MKRKIRKRTLRLLEFLIIGVVVGLIEDLLAVTLATDAHVTPRVFVIVLAVAIPFAFLSEYVVDHPRFWQSFFKVVKKEATDVQHNLENHIQKREDSRH